MVATPAEHAAASTPDDISGLYAHFIGGRRVHPDGAPDLDVSHPLPVAPWFEHASWSPRRVLLHVIAETAQHAGHADIIRESLDGSKTMG